MGPDGTETETDQAPTHGTSGFQKLGEPSPDRPSDQELADQRQTELDADREEHNRRTGGGNFPTSDKRS